MLTHSHGGLGIDFLNLYFSVICEIQIKPFYESSLPVLKKI